MNNSIDFQGLLVRPSKVVCVGRNYVDHIKELDNAMPSEPVVFVKSNSAITSDLVLRGTDEVHYEGELSFLVQGGELVAVAFGLDLTKRLIQNKLKEQGLPWERAKAFDHSAVFSAFVPFNGPIEDLRLELEINSKIQQQGGCSMMIYSPHNLLTEINSFMTLIDGDVLMTGTPAGVGQVNIGDSFIGRVFNNNKLLLETTWVVKSS